MAAGSGVRGSLGGRRWLLALGVVALAGSGALAPIAVGAADPSADLSVAVVHTPDSATAPATVTFTVTATNDGPDTAENVAAGLGYQYPLELRTPPAGCRRSASYESLICELGDIAAGSSTSIDIALEARGSGLFTLPVVVASDTPDPDAEDRVATDSLLVKAGPSQAVRYITGIFPAIMGRNPATASTNYWASRWKAENNRYPRKLERVPAGIMDSNEYRRIRIRESYERILGRAADAPSLTFWVNKAAGGWSFERIDTTLLSSREFLRKGDRAASIRNTFVAVLGRQPSAGELAQWNKALAPGGGTSWSTFARSLQRSTEGYDAVINQHYQSALGHAPSSLGRYVWQVRLRQGVSPESLWAQLFVSSEVLAKYPYTVDDYEDGYEYAVPVSSVQAALDAS